MQTISQEKLNELKTTVPHFVVTDGLPANYSEGFAQPADDGTCLCCGAYASFTWGLQHGEGSCAKCGWPARMYHFIKTPEGEDKRVVRLLQYHPAIISIGADE